MDKVRLDILLTEKGLAPSREKARALIMSGAVLINDRPFVKAGDFVDPASPIRLKHEHDCPYVSRGGMKLEKAVRVFGLSLSGKICADIGASTGGFTDCMLQNGATRVYAIDVGYGQLDWKLRQDERVCVMERTNARYLTEDDLSGIEFCSVDVSFISLKLIFPAIADICTDKAELVTLIKPQFEAGRKYVGKKGVVKDPSVHRMVIQNVLKYASDSGYFMHGLSYSPIKGPNGNIEYIACYNRVMKSNITDTEISDVVEDAHKNL